MQRSPQWIPRSTDSSIRPMQLTEEDYVKQAIFNVVNSFQQPDFISAMEHGSSISTTQVSIKRFQYNVGVLFSLVKNSLDQDEEWKKMKEVLGEEESVPFELFSKMFQEFKERFKVKVPDLGRV